MYAGREQGRNYFRILGPKSKYSSGPLKGNWKTTGQRCLSYNVSELVRVFIYLIQEGVEYDSEEEINKDVIESPLFNSDGLVLKDLSEEMQKKITKFIGPLGERVRKASLCEELEKMFDRLRRDKMKKV